MNSRDNQHTHLTAKNGITRREALTRTALAGAGFWIAGPSRRVRAAGPNEKLNIACIGVGGRGVGNIKGLCDENLVAFCDVDDARAAKIYNAFPSVRRFRDFRRMFDKMEKEIDAVVVSTPDHTHFHPSMWALERGKHLFCEKPIAPVFIRSGSSQQKVIQRRRRVGSTTQVRCLKRYYSPTSLIVPEADSIGTRKT